MSLKYAMLGFIDMMPISGYDLKKMFNSSVKFYWTATHSQIYRTLNEMNNEELVEVEFIQQNDLPNKKIYHITEKGKKELIKWITASSELPPIRHKLLVQLSWADRLSTKQIIELLQNYSNKLKERLALYASEEHQQTILYARSKREQFLWKAILENGVSTYEAELKWSLDTILNLKNFNE
jgi:PadR family transcriptional regulator AphA